MDKVKIKRVKRVKKKITTKDKVLAGLGLGSTLLGGVSSVASKPQNTQFVRTTTTEQTGTKEKVKDVLKRIFGVTGAEAEELTPQQSQAQQLLATGKNPDGSAATQEQLASANQIYYGQVYNNAQSVIQAQKDQPATNASADSFAGGTKLTDAQGGGTVNHIGTQILYTAPNGSSRWFNNQAELDAYIKEANSPALQTISQNYNQVTQGTFNAPELKVTQSAPVLQNEPVSSNEGNGFSNPSMTTPELEEAQRNLLENLDGQAESSLPANPQVGQTFTEDAGVTYTYQGNNQWIAQAGQEKVSESDGYVYISDGSGGWNLKDGQSRDLSGVPYISLGGQWVVNDGGARNNPDQTPTRPNVTITDQVNIPVTTTPSSPSSSRGDYIGPGKRWATETDFINWWNGQFGPSQSNTQAPKTIDPESKAIYKAVTGQDPYVWEQNVTINNSYDGSTYQANEGQFANKETAERLASQLGGTVEVITYPLGPYSLSKPMYMVNVDGVQMNAGMLAQRYQNNSQWFADLLTQTEIARSKGQTPPTWDEVASTLNSGGNVYGVSLPATNTDYATFQTEEGIETGYQGQTVVIRADGTVVNKSTGQIVEVPEDVLEKIKQTTPVDLRGMSDAEKFKYFSNVTITLPDGSKHIQNGTQFATYETAKQIADSLGGKVVVVQGYGFSHPQYSIVFEGSDYVGNAGLIASMIERNGAAATAQIIELEKNRGKNSTPPAFIQEATGDLKKDTQITNLPVSESIQTATFEGQPLGSNPAPIVTPTSIADLSGFSESGTTQTSSSNSSTTGTGSGSTQSDFFGNSGSGSAGASGGSTSGGSGNSNTSSNSNNTSGSGTMQTSSQEVQSYVTQGGGGSSSVTQNGYSTFQGLQMPVSGNTASFEGLKMPAGYPASDGLKMPEGYNASNIQGATTAGTYTVKKGDTLWSIAKKYYGDGKKWRKILEANTSKVKSPQTLQIGTVLVIPEK